MCSIKLIRQVAVIGLLGLVLFGIGLRLLNIVWLPLPVHWAAALGVLIGVGAWGFGGVWGLSALSSEFLHLAVKDFWQRSFRAAKSYQVPSTFQQWAKNRGVSGFAKLYILPGPELNAAVDVNRNLWVTQDLLESPGTELAKGIINHEITHIEAKHVLRGAAMGALAVLATLTMGELMFPGDGVSPLSIAASVLAYLLTFSIVSWRHEYQADSGAVEVVGPQNYVQVLQTLRPVSLWNRDSFTHPPLRDRIRAIQRAWLT